MNRREFLKLSAVFGYSMSTIEPGEFFAGGGVATISEASIPSLIAKYLSEAGSGAKSDKFVTFRIDSQGRAYSFLAIENPDRRRSIYMDVPTHLYRGQEGTGLEILDYESLSNKGWCLKLKPDVTPYYGERPLVELGFDGVTKKYSFRGFRGGVADMESPGGRNILEQIVNPESFGIEYMPGWDWEGYSQEMLDKFLKSGGVLPESQTFTEFSSGPSSYGGNSAAFGHSHYYMTRFLGVGYARAKPGVKLEGYGKLPDYARDYPVFSFGTRKTDGTPFAFSLMAPPRVTILNAIGERMELSFDWNLLLGSLGGPVYSGRTWQPIWAGTSEKLGGLDTKVMPLRAVNQFFGGNETIVALPVLDYEAISRILTRGLERKDGEAIWLSRYYLDPNWGRSILDPSVLGLSVDDGMKPREVLSLVLAKIKTMNLEDLLEAYRICNLGKIRGIPIGMAFGTFNK